MERWLNSSRSILNGGTKRLRSHQIRQENFNIQRSALLAWQKVIWERKQHMKAILQRSIDIYAFQKYRDAFWTLRENRRLCVVHDSICRNLVIRRKQQALYEWIYQYKYQIRRRQQMIRMVSIRKRFIVSDVLQRLRDFNRYSKIEEILQKAQVRFLVGRSVSAWKAHKHMCVYKRGIIQRMVSIIERQHKKVGFNHLRIWNRQLKEKEQWAGTTFDHILKKIVKLKMIHFWREFVKERRNMRQKIQSLEDIYKWTVFDNISYGFFSWRENVKALRDHPKTVVAANGHIMKYRMPCRCVSRTCRHTTCSDPRLKKSLDKDWYNNHHCESSHHAELRLEDAGLLLEKLNENIEKIKSEPVKQFHHSKDQKVEITAKFPPRRQHPSGPKNLALLHKKRLSEKKPRRRRSYASEISSSRCPRKPYDIKSNLSTQDNPHSTSSITTTSTKRAFNIREKYNVHSADSAIPSSYHKHISTSRKLQQPHVNSHSGISRQSRQTLVLDRDFNAAKSKEISVNLSPMVKEDNKNVMDGLSPWNNEVGFMISESSVPINLSTSFSWKNPLEPVVVTPVSVSRSNEKNKVKS
eukprot:TRINITY_DN241_c1_g1_i1.p1 TRINITY_DN241_c1_g1~~TRINITY_DN241_c1_g1_i1.p1  ORF type:complete len:600 (-),score=73.82 TRINITY_DN241_c1_g1_i1:85-1827(-)